MELTAQYMSETSAPYVDFAYQIPMHPSKPVEQCAPQTLTQTNQMPIMTPLYPFKALITGL